MKTALRSKPSAVCRALATGPGGPVALLSILLVLNLACHWIGRSH